MLTLTLVQPQKTQTKQTATDLVTPMIYVAAPYSEPDPVANTKHAIRIADALLSAGFTPLVPHLTMLWDLVSPKPYEEWLDYDRELLARCDAVLRVPGYSVGATREVRFAESLRIPRGLRPLRPQLAGVWMICTLCFTPFDERDSLGSLDGLCQDCWESACSVEWWETVASLPGMISTESSVIEPVESGASAS